MYFGTQSARLQGRTLGNWCGRPDAARLDGHGHALARTAGSDLTKPRHDSIKWCIDALMREAEMPRSSSLETSGRATPKNVPIQGLLPEFMYERSPPHRTLGDVKCIAVCKSHYSGTNLQQRCGAVNARQRQVTSQYQQKAKRADRKYNDTLDGTVGPLQAALRRFGPVDGLVFGEASPHVEQLVQAIAAAMQCDTGAHWGLEVHSKRSQCSSHVLASNLESRQSAVMRF